jgi:acyl-CoA thioesterase-2
MSALDDVVALLDLARVDEHRFRSVALDTDHVRAYGGQLVAQALTAAGGTVPPERAVHSLHAYFLRSPAPSASIDFTVEPMRDSGTFTSRRVVAEQDGRAVLSLETSFHAPEEGPEAHDPMPAVAAPDEMVAIDDWKLAQAMPDQERDVPYFIDAIEYRQSPDTLPDGAVRTQHEPVRDIWVRAAGALPEQPLLHACVLAYALDKPLLGTTVLAPPVCGDPSTFLIVSLDLSMWFHRPCRADDWILFHLHSSATGQGRAFARAECFRRDGALVLSATQQGLLRPLSTS